MATFIASVLRTGGFPTEVRELLVSIGRLLRNIAAVRQVQTHIPTAADALAHLFSSIPVELRALIFSYLLHPARSPGLA